VNKVVARFIDGRMVKGTTADFFPAKELFHVIEEAAPPRTPATEINTKDLKALFFVIDFAGDPQHSERNKFDPAHVPVVRQIKVTFLDGEVLVGSTTGYQPGRPGFFLVPADTGSNIERCYVFSAATQEISFI